MATDGREPANVGVFKKIIRTVLPIAVIVGALAVVVILVSLARGKRPERVETGDTAVLVDTITAEQRSLNFTVINGKHVSATPSFYGNNPGRVKEGRRKGLVTLAVEENVARALVKSLNAEQKKKAVIASPRMVPRRKRLVRMPVGLNWAPS